MAADKDKQAREQARARATERQAHLDFLAERIPELQNLDRSPAKEGTVRPPGRFPGRLARVEADREWYERKRQGA